MDRHGEVTQGEKKRKVERHLLAGLLSAPSSSHRKSFLLVTNVLFHPSATRGTRAMRGQRKNRLFWRVNWAELRKFCSSIFSSVMNIFKLEKKKAHGTRDHETLVTVTDSPLLSHVTSDVTFISSRLIFPTWDPLSTVVS